MYELFKTRSSTNPRTSKAVYYYTSSSEPKRWLIIPDIVSKFLTSFQTEIWCDES